MAFDNSSGEKWFGGNELLKYDGKEWTLLTTKNSGLPGNNVNDVEIDKNHVKWIATDNGLAKYDGTTWSVINTSNSPLASNEILATAFDASGNVWILTSEEVVVYKGK